MQKQLITLKEAQKLVLDQVKLASSETASIDSAYGRVLAEDIIADRDYPPFNRSAMDGIAIKSIDLSETTVFQIKETVFAGQEAKEKLSQGECYRIMTGAPVPDSADVVIRIEDVEIKNLEAAVKIDQVKAFQNIAKKGEDAQQGTVLIKKGSLITPASLTSLASLGYSQVKVFKRPSVTIITTGDEIKDVDEPVLPFQIRDSNSHTLKGFLKNYMLDEVKVIRVADQKEKIQKALELGLTSQIVILTGGVSMGEADFIPELLMDNGVRKVFHKVAIKPGKPIWFGHSDSTVVFGLPGNPLSCQVNFLLFVELYLREFFGMDPKKPFYLPISQDKMKKGTLDVFYPAILKKESQLQVDILPFNGSGDIKATQGSEGIILHPSTVVELKKEDLVAFYPWSVSV